MTRSDLMSLNEAMEFDHVIRVFVDGTFSDAEKGVYAPEVAVEIAEDDAGSVTDEAEAAMIAMVERQGWQLMTGYTGQCGYNGPLMHASEFVGGGMERDILAESGLYVVVEPTGLYQSEEQEERDGGRPVGWVVARRRDDDQPEVAQ